MEDFYECEISDTGSFILRFFLGLEFWLDMPWSFVDLEDWPYLNNELVVLEHIHDLILRFLYLG